jgi:DeoR/GlpR family transcriptional regulator of sugar metabolism
MIRIERQAKILQIIHEREYIENIELAHIFDVTQATIRRDLKALSEQGLIRMDHGGASTANQSHINEEPLYETKVFVNHEAKQAIGKAAAALVHDGDSIILDSGTTNAAIARALIDARHKNLTVITCDIMIAKDLCGEEDMNVIVLGGLMRKSYFSTYGAYTEYILKNMHADKYFLGIDGANLEHGITNIVLEEVPIKQLQIEISDQVILVADSTKFDKTAPHRVCTWNAIDMVITDTCTPQEYIDFFSRKDIQVTAVATCQEPVFA